MNATENPAVQSYLKKVSSLLECPRQRKKEMLRGIELLIGEHLHPDGSVRYEEIVAAIGTPEEVVEAYIGTEDPVKLSQSLKRRKRFWIAGILIAVLLAVMAALYVIDVIDKTTYSNGYFVDTIVPDSSMDLDPGSVVGVY